MRKAIIPMIFIVLLVATASALEIKSPENNETYNESTIPLIIESNETYNEITYTLHEETDNQTIIYEGCMNCTGFNATITAKEGNNTLTVTGYKENETKIANTTFYVVLPEIEQPENFTLNITSPENKTYNTSIIPVNITANTTLDNITFYVGNYSMACITCSGIITDMNLSDGEYLLIAEGVKGNLSKNATVNFKVNTTIPEEPKNFTITIENPKNVTYNTSTVPVKIKANTTLDNITITIGNLSESCTNCSELAKNLYLTNGTYTLHTTGKLGNITHNESVTFTVKILDKPPKEDEPRFTLGLQHLPQAVERGELTDSKLAEIIRENHLNPGIINRLIKTGKLGEESIDAILETQFNPPGIFRKILGFFGVQTSTYATKIHETYDLTESNLQNLVTREDLPSNAAEQVKQQLQEKTTQRGPPTTPPGQAKKEVAETANGEEKEPEEQQRGPPVVIGAQNGDDENWLPPGLAKKNKVPPGHAKR